MYWRWSEMDSGIWIFPGLTDLYFNLFHRFASISFHFMMVMTMLTMYMPMLLFMFRLVISMMLMFCWISQCDNAAGYSSASISMFMASWVFPWSQIIWSGMNLKCEWMLQYFNWINSTVILLWYTKNSLLKKKKKNFHADSYCFLAFQYQSKWVLPEMSYSFAKQKLKKGRISIFDYLILFQYGSFSPFISLWHLSELSSL